MKVVFYSDVLNLHQAPLADALWDLTGHRYCFVELKTAGEKKGGREDYSSRPYLLRAWAGKENYDRAMELARTADCCVFSGTSSLRFEKERLRLNRLSFDMSERWLKHGPWSLLSPRLLQWMFAYYAGGWRKKAFYKLCCSAFCAEDHARIGSLRGKCYKWGYFTGLGERINLGDAGGPVSEATPIMWCSRFVRWKHPELPILLAARLKSEGNKFSLSMFGTGGCEEKMKEMSRALGVEDVVTFLGEVPNDKLREQMRKHEIFLFTSDRREGWGVVANESMSESCVLVASDGIGSVPYLLEENDAGRKFCAPSPCSSYKRPDVRALNSLFENVAWLLDHPVERRKMRMNARALMERVWSPGNAARNLLVLIDGIVGGNDSIVRCGPGSKA